MTIRTLDTAIKTMYNKLCLLITADCPPDTFCFRLRFCVGTGALGAAALDIPTAAWVMYQVMRLPCHLESLSLTFVSFGAANRAPVRIAVIRPSLTFRLDAGTTDTQINKISDIECICMFCGMNLMMPSWIVGIIFIDDVSIHVQPPYVCNTFHVKIFSYRNISKEAVYLSAAEKPLFIAFAIIYITTSSHILS
jgi:hypothetical protein